MKNKNLLSRTRKFAYFFGCLILATYFVASPHKAEASFLGDIWNSIVKISDFSSKTTPPDGIDTLNSSNTAAVIVAVTQFDITKVKELSDEIFSANADPLKKQLLLNLAKERETLIKELMRKDPALFLSLAIRASQRNLLPLNIQPYIEKEATLTSKIEVIHYDDFKNPQNSRFDYFLKDIDGKTKINFYPTEPLNLTSGAVVKASGFRLDNNFVSLTNKRSFEVTETPALASTGDQKTLVILLDFNNSPARPFTKEKAYDMVFNDQFQKFYKEQSYNQVSFSGDVVDWFKLNRNDYLNANNSGSACGRFEFTWSEVGQIIKDRGINLAKYKRLIFLPNNQSSGGWSSVGSSDYEINGQSYNFSYACIGVNSFNSNSWWGNQPFEWKNIDFLLSHELGHSLGVVHANGWDCGDKSLGDNCTHIEYGNYFDTMGTNSRALHFNALYKEILGWIKSSQILEINKSGTYSINTLEKDSAIKFAKISNYTQKDTPYYLEYRRAFGFDSKLKEQDISSNQTGLFINKKKSENYGYDMSRLIDASPTTDSWWDDTVKVTLNSNATFTDPDNGITIDNVSNPTENSIDFRMTYNKPSSVDLTLDKTSDGNDIVKLYAWRDIFNDYGETVDSDFTDGETKTLRNDWHYKLSAIPDSSSLGFGGWIGCDSQTQGNSWTDADGVTHYSKPSSGEKACFVELNDESKQIEVDFTEPSEISASPNPVNSGQSATLTWAADDGPGNCYLYSPTDNLKTIKSSAFYLDTNSSSRFYKGAGYYVLVGRNSSGTTANLTASTDYTLTCDIETLNNAVSYNLKVGIASSGTSGSSSSSSPYDNYSKGASAIFDYTGGAQQYIIPDGVNIVSIETYGASGGAAGGGGGKGGYASAIFDVNPSDILYINVGGAGEALPGCDGYGRRKAAGGFNGGGDSGSTIGCPGTGGGGASDVRKGTNPLDNRIIVAGGGGGGGGGSTGKGGGGGGGDGGNGKVVGNGGGFGGSGGNSNISGGVGGTGVENGGNGISSSGGKGGNGTWSEGMGSGGGGGGGYYGGGGGGSGNQTSDGANDGGGGGGGSSYTSGLYPEYQNGVNIGNGKVIITTLFPKSSSSSSSSGSANYTAITELATNITSTSTTLNGAINPKGESVYYQFFYRKESESSTTTKKTSYVFAGSGTSDVSVSAQISDLSPGTKYVYRLYAYSYTTDTEVKGDLKSFTTTISTASSSAVPPSSSSSNSSSSISYGIAETRPYFVAGQEANDIVGVKYKFKIANNDGQNMKILFGGSRLSGTGADTYYLERNIYNSKVSYSDPVCVGGWEQLNVMTIGQSTLRIAVPDYIKKGKTGLKTGNASYFPRITYGIDNVADVTKTDVISQANLNGQEGTIETLRGDIISDKSGWKCNNQNLDGDVYRQWNVKTTIGASAYQTSIALPENGAKYLTPYELINFRTEFFQNAGLFKVYLWDFQFQRESKTNWGPLTQWKVSDYDGSTANYGVRKTVYNGNNAIEISNDNSLNFLAKNATFELLQAFSSSSSSSSVSSSSSSVASSSLLAYYAFDGEREKGSVITYDYSGNGNNGTIIGATRTQTGKYGGGLSFDGIDDYVDLGNPANLQPGKISLSAWFKTDSSGGMIMRKRLYGYGLEMLSSGKISFWIYNSAAAKFSAISPNVYNDGQWHHALGIYDGSAVKLYIDGYQAASATAGKIYYGAGGIAIGRDGNSSVSYFKGLIDQVRLYNYPLSSSEINKLYEEGASSSSKSSSSSSSSSSSTGAKGSLSISVSFQPESQNVPAGSAQFTFTNYILNAKTSAEDIVIKSLPLEYFASSRPTALTNCKLYNNLTSLNTGVNAVNPVKSASSTNFNFDSNFIVPAGTGQTLALKCDVSGSANVGDYYSWGYDISSDPVITGKTSSSNIDETEYDNPGGKMTIIYDCENSRVCFGSSSSATNDFTAYNDLSWSAGQANTNITLYTKGQNGLLKDYSTGANTPVTLTIAGGDISSSNHLIQGSNANSGTDAYTVFNGIVNSMGLISYSGPNLTFTFTGLDPNLNYEFVLFGNRNDASYTNRTTTTAISDVESFANASTGGATFSGANDPAVTIVNGYNTVNGYVARFTNIKPGADGDILITVSSPTGQFYANALMLRATQSPVSSSSSSSSSLSSSSSSVANGLSNGLVTQYRFDGGSANDSYGNNNGNIFGAVSSGGIAGGALSFDGDDYVQIPGLLNNPANITISAWANLTSSDTNGAEIISLGDHVNLRLQDPAESFGVSASYRYANGWRTVRYGANYAGTGWHHFAYVVDDSANSQKLYVDGALASTTSYTDSIVYTGLGANTFIGKHGNGSNTNYDFNGSIDEVKIYNRALTAEEVSRLYSLPGINCDISGGCAMGYKINWLNQIGAVLESIGQTIKQIFIIKKQQ